MPARIGPVTAALFDMDKTILAENSGAVYMRHRYEEGSLALPELLRGLGAYLQYKLGVLDIRTWTTGMLAEYEGRRETDLISEGEELFETLIRPLIYPEARSLIAEHHAAGHVVAIVSGSPRFLVEPLAQHLGVKYRLYTRLEVEEGVLTGRAIEPLCFEDGKIYWLERFIADHGIDLAKSYFYTDSVTDLPLLDLVGHPVVTNPDPILYRKARRRRWPVRLFVTPPDQNWK